MHHMHNLHNLTLSHGKSIFNSKSINQSTEVFNSASDESNYSVAIANTRLELLTRQNVHAHLIVL